MTDKISLSPVRVKGIYYSVTYKEYFPEICLEQTGLPVLTLTGMKAQYFINLLKQTNGYDMIVELIEYKNSLTKEREK